MSLGLDRKELRAKVYARAKELLREGLSVRQIAERLNQEGFVSVTGMPFTKSNVGNFVPGLRKDLVTGSGSPEVAVPQIKYEPTFAKFVLNSGELDDSKKVAILKMLV